MPGSSRGTRRDLRALLGVRRVGSGLGRARGRRAEEGAHRFGSWVAAAGVCQTANKRSIWPAEAAAREERCCRRPSECSSRCAEVRKPLKSHYWFQARGQLASCKTLASRFVLRRTSAPPRRRSHAYLAPTRHWIAEAVFSLHAGQDHSTQAKSTQGAQPDSQFIAIFTTSASCSSQRRETAEHREL